MNANVHTCATPLEWLSWDLAGDLSGIDDGARYELPNGDTITVTLEHDASSTLTDYDYFGRVEFVPYNRSHYISGQGQRPDDMNGNAEKVAHDHGAWWWQPPADVARGTPEFDALRTHVRGWFNDDWCYCGVVVTVRGDRRSLDRAASLWGVESNSSTEYLAEIIGDLLADCGVTFDDITGEPEDAQCVA